MSKQTRVLSVTAGILLAAVTFAAVASSRPIARADDDSALDQAMGKLNRGFRALRAPVASGDFAKVLEALPGMQEGVIQAKGELPHRVEEEKDPAVRAEKQKQFRLQMISLLEELLTLEKAALAGDKEKLAASVEKVRAIQKAGHDEFKEPEEKEHGGR